MVEYRLNIWHKMTDWENYLLIIYYVYYIEHTYQIASVRTGGGGGGGGMCVRTLWMAPYGLKLCTSLLFLLLQSNMAARPPSLFCFFLRQIRVVNSWMVLATKWQCHI